MSYLNKLNRTEKILALARNSSLAHELPRVPNLTTMDCDKSNQKSIELTDDNLIQCCDRTLQVHEPPKVPDLKTADCDKSNQETIDNDDSFILQCCDRVLEEISEMLVPNDIENVPIYEGNDTLETCVPENSHFTEVLESGSSTPDDEDSNSNEMDDTYTPEESHSEDSSTADTETQNNFVTNGNNIISQENENQKRNKKAKAVEWKRNQTKKRRMEGKSYYGYTRGTDGIVKHEKERAARKLGPPCGSKMCQKSKTRHCYEFTEAQRVTLFEPFWQTMNWDQKRLYVISLIKQSDKKRCSSKNNDQSRRSFSCQYFLYRKNEKKMVCKRMFLATLGLKETMVRKWIKKANNDNRMIASKDKWPKKISVKSKNNEKQILREWLGSIPTMESHYCRKETSKKYVEQQFQSKAEVYRAYCKYCEENGHTALSNWSFYETFNELNLALYRPRKDQCDICCSYEVGQVSDVDYQLHVQRKDRARAEKEADKQNAISGNCYIFTMDLQAVKQCPVIPASALYFKTKLTVHNFTVYNLVTHQCSNYWWHEGEGDLSASSFTSLIIEHLNAHCTNKNLPIIMYSDGCCYQNRNAVLANALLLYSQQNKVVVIQKYLEKGHTEMECDSTHSIIERKLKNRKIILPSDYIRITEEARTKPFPLDAVYITHDVFLNYADNSLKQYDSIRPGKKAHDPTVTDIRVLKYDNGTLFYKLSFDDTFAEMPIRKKKNISLPIPPPEKLHAEKLKIPETKWKHLQQLKKELPVDVHYFYDQLPYEK